MSPVEKAINQGLVYEEAGESPGDLKRAIDQYRLAVRIDPNHGIAKARLGLTLLRLHAQEPAEQRIEEARSLIAQAAILEPDDWFIWHARARLHFNDEEYERAVEAAREANARVPENERNRDLPLALLGVARIESGEIEAGLDALREAAEVGRGSIQSRPILANALRKLERDDEAITEYNKALRANPANIKALNNLGLLYTDRGSHHEALPLLKKAFEMSPLEAKVANSLGIVYFHLAYAGESDYWDDAILAFKTALQLREDYANPLVGLADIHWVQGRHDLAAPYLQRAIDAYDSYLESIQDPRLVAARAVCVAKLGQREEAIAAIEGLQKEIPKAEWLDIYAARVHAVLGNSDQVYHHARLAVKKTRHRSVFSAYPEFREYQDDPEFRAIRDEF